MSDDEGIVLVAGATGQQGGAVARHLLAGGFAVRGSRETPTRRRPSPYATPAWSSFAPT